MKRWIVGGLVVLVAGTAFATVWNGTFEGIPNGANLVSDLDTFIQTFKVETRFRGSVEQEWGTTGGDNGLFRVGSARAFVQNAAPTDIAGPGMYNNAGAGSYGATLLSTTELNGSDDLGKGRLWVDADGSNTSSTATSDDNQLKVWNETANAFQDVTTRDASGAGIGAQNLVYNGSFEVTDGTGATGSTTTPAGWTNLNTSTIAYTDPTGVSEGEGLALRTTAAGGANEGVRQALASLKAGVTYVFRARARPAAVANGCNLSVSDGVTTVTDTSTASGSYQTLEAILTTTAAPATVNVDLRSTADTNVCDWDEVVAFERNASVKQAGAQFCNSSDTTTGTNYGGGAMVAVPGLSCAITPPASSYAVEVDLSVCVDNETGGGSAGVEVELQENGSTVAWGAGVVLNDTTGGAQRNVDLACIPVRFVRVQPTPGTTLTYTAKAGSNQTTVNSNDQDAESISAFATASTLRVKLTPTH